VVAFFLNLFGFGDGVGHSCPPLSLKRLTSNKSSEALQC
jgi:hypothetical protein